MSGFELLVSEVAKIAKCHWRTVINYTSRGVLPDCRDSRGFRRYRLEDALRLRGILEHREIKVKANG